VNARGFSRARGVWYAVHDIPLRDAPARLSRNLPACRYIARLGPMFTKIPSNTSYSTLVELFHQTVKLSSSPQALPRRAWRLFQASRTSGLPTSSGNAYKSSNSDHVFFQSAKSWRRGREPNRDELIQQQVSSIAYTMQQLDTCFLSIKNTNVRSLECLHAAEHR
jgi:hypothetical protein